MPGFGKKLRREREKHGLPLADVARDINVGPQLLEALENDDLAALPGGPFNRGIVRAYARRLSLDPDKIIRRYGREERARGLSTPDADRKPRHRRVEIHHDGDRPTLVIDWRLARSLLVFCGVGLAAGSLVLFLVARQPGARAAAAPAATHEVESPPAVVGAETTSAATVDEEHADTSAAMTVAPEKQHATDDKTTDDVPDAPSNLRITDAGIGAGIEEERPVGTDEPFRVGDRVWFWTRAVDGSGESVEHVWLQEGRTIARYTLDVQGPTWRNASFKTLWDGSAGRWTVEARAAGGRVLARREFVCIGPEGAAGTRLNADAPPTRGT